MLGPAAGGSWIWCSGRDEGRGSAGALAGLDLGGPDVAHVDRAAADPGHVGAGGAEAHPVRRALGAGTDAPVHDAEATQVGLAAVPEGLAVGHDARGELVRDAGAKLQHLRELLVGLPDDLDVDGAEALLVEQVLDLGVAQRGQRQADQGVLEVAVLQIAIAQVDDVLRLPDALAAEHELCARDGHEVGDALVEPLVAPGQDGRLGVRRGREAVQQTLGEPVHGVGVDELEGAPGAHLSAAVVAVGPGASVHDLPLRVVERTEVVDDAGVDAGLLSTPLPREQVVHGARAGEDAEVDVFTLAQVLHVLALAVEQADHVARQAGLEADLQEGLDHGAGQLVPLHDEQVPADQRADDLQPGDLEREVVGGDEPADAVGAVELHSAVLPLSLDRLADAHVADAVAVVGPHVPQRQLDLSSRLCLLDLEAAHHEPLHLAQVLARVQEVGPVAEDVGPLLHSDLVAGGAQRPAVLEGVDGAADLVLTGCRLDEADSGAALERDLGRTVDADLLDCPVRHVVREGDRGRGAAAVSDRQGERRKQRRDGVRHWMPRM